MAVKKKKTTKKKASKKKMTKKKTMRKKTSKKKMSKKKISKKKKMTKAQMSKKKKVTKKKTRKVRKKSGEGTKQMRRQLEGLSASSAGKEAKIKSLRRLKRARIGKKIAVGAGAAGLSALAIQQGLDYIKGKKKSSKKKVSRADMQREDRKRIGKKTKKVAKKSTYRLPENIKRLVGKLTSKKAPSDKVMKKRPMAKVRRSRTGVSRSEVRKATAKYLSPSFLKSKEFKNLSPEKRRSMMRLLRKVRKERSGK